MHLSLHADIPNSNISKRSLLMPKYLLDPLNLDTDLPSLDDSPSSYDLKQMLIKIINKSTSHFIPHGEYPMIYNNKAITLELNVDLLIRPRSRHSQKRIEILAAQEINTGAFGSIRQIYGVLIPEDNFAFKKKSPEKSRICKVIAGNTLERKTAIFNEAYYTKLNPLLHSKGAVLSGKTGYLVMRKAQEQDLYYLIDNLHLKSAILTIEQRLELTCIIIKAVIEQVHDLGMTHNDIKPENIIIDTKRLTATFIDYAFAHHIGGISENEVQGTPEFLAPELLHDYRPTIKSDGYALGLSIGSFWGYVSQANFNKNFTLKEIETFHRMRKWSLLFNAIPLSLDMQDKIRQSLDQMTALNPKDRITPKQSLVQWEQILSDYKEWQLKQPSISDSNGELISLGYTITSEEEFVLNHSKTAPLPIVHHHKKLSLPLHGFFKPQAANTSNSQGEDDSFDDHQSDCKTQ